MAINFYIPPTLEQDFDEFLANAVTNQVVSAELIRNWYDRNDPSYEPQMVRSEWYPDSTKSRYENTDNNINVRFSLKTDVRKGDMIIHPNDDIFVLDWDIAPEHNNKASRALRCNLWLTVKRWINDVVDPETGMVITPAHYETIVEPIPANAYHYSGRPEHSTIYGAPGVVPNDLTILTVQYNPQTAKIHISDTFMWGADELTIISISNIGLDMVHPDGTGVLLLHAKKLAGGIDYAD